MEDLGSIKVAHPPKKKQYSRLVLHFMDGVDLPITETFFTVLFSFIPFSYSFRIHFVFISLSFHPHLLKIYTEKSKRQGDRQKA